MPQNSFLSEILTGQEIPPGKRAYFQERLRNRLYSLILSEFAKRHNEEGLTQAAVAMRIQKRPEQVNRWLGSPGNWTLGTVSDLLLGIGGAELDFSINPLCETPRNHIAPSWFSISMKQDQLVNAPAINKASEVFNIYVTRESDPKKITSEQEIGQQHE